MVYMISKSSIFQHNLEIYFFILIQFLFHFDRFQITYFFLACLINFDLFLNFGNDQQDKLAI